MSISVSVREAHAGDRASIFRLLEILDEHHRIALPKVFRRPLGERREQIWFDTIIAGPDSVILVAEGSDCGIVGLAVLIVKAIPATIVRDARQFVEIDQFVVDPEARRAGVGRELVEATRKWTSARGHLNLELSAWSFNVDAIAFYRQAGFERIGERLAMAEF